MNILQPRCLSLVQRHIVLRRPPSVGMPRHALRRRMPNIRVSAVAARWPGIFFQQNLCRWGRGPGRLLTGIHTMQNLSQFSDLRIQPVGFAQNWHRASLKDYKNFFLVAFFD